MSSNYPVINKATDQNAIDVPTDTVAFNNRLDSGDIDVQKALEKLDDHIETGSSTTLDTTLFDGILSATQDTVQKAFDWFDDLLKRAFVFNPDNTDIDFTINKNTSGQAYVYDAGTDTHTWDAPADQTLLTSQPTGGTPLAIATTQYVDSAVAAEDFWDRSGTTILPQNAGDSLSIDAAATFNTTQGDNDFIINKQTSDEAYKYDAGIDTHFIRGDFVPLGSGSTVSATNVVIGSDAQLIDKNETETVVIGSSATANDNYSTVVGSSAYSDGGEDNVVMGDYTFANGNNSTSIGSFSKLGDDGPVARSVLLGADSIIGNHDNKNIIGSESYMYGDRTQGLGNYQKNGLTQSLASDQILLGHGATYSGANTFQVGGNRVRINVTGKTGNFTDGEVVTGGTSGATARAVDDALDNVFDLQMTSATNFQVGELITGATSGHTATASTVDFSTYQSDINTVNFNRGVGIVTFENPLRFNGTVFDTIETSTTETIDIGQRDLIIQTASGITTSLTGSVTGQKIMIKNSSGGTNTLGITIEGNASPLIYDGEGFNLLYSGTEWVLL